MSQAVTAMRHVSGKAAARCSACRWRRAGLLRRTLSTPASQSDTGDKKAGPGQVANSHYRVVVAGAGTGGSAVANKIVSKVGKGNVAVIDPKDTHYYQPMFTLVGAGLKELEQTHTPVRDVLSSGVTWLQQAVLSLQPELNTVTLQNGDKITYDYLVVAMGLQINFDKIKGLPEAFETPGVCSNYTPATVMKTREAMEGLKGGRAIFTFPATPIKCPGAPQKIMYLCDAYWTDKGVRKDIEVMYNSALGVIFGVKKYADSLWKVCQARNLNVNLKTNLVEVKPDSKEAVFAILDENNVAKDHVTYKYDMLHVGPPCSAPDVVRASPLADAASGFVAVDRDTLRSTTHPNVFALGDCSSAPTSKTAAACATQAHVVYKNLSDVMDGRDGRVKTYDGYTSCPLLTGHNKCILAEFDYNLQPLETFPLDQGKERYTMYYLKKEFMPPLYWHGLVKGWWNGPKLFRRLLSFGMRS